jgi:hypothetical protein
VPASVPQVRIVLTPRSVRSAAREANSVTEGPQVTPFTVHGRPSTSRHQFGLLPATRTAPSAGPVVQPGVVGAGVVVAAAAKASTSHSE